MPRNFHCFTTTIVAVALAAFAAGAAQAQKPKGSTIICWKDKSGKVIGCGDSVPPEFQDSATQQMDRTGVTRKTTESAEVQARRKAEEAAQAQQKEAEKKRLAEQKRQDTALLNTYANEKEIDQRRNRELLVVDRQLDQLRVLHKNAGARHAESVKRLAAAESANKPSDALKDEIARAEADTVKLERTIAAREKERESILARYARTKQRFLEISPGVPQSAAPPAKK